MQIRTGAISCYELTRNFTWNEFIETKSGRVSSKQNSENFTLMLSSLSWQSLAIDLEEIGNLIDINSLTLSKLSTWLLSFTIDT